jgi:hypothetical protein
MKPPDDAQRLCHRLVDPASRFEVSPGSFAIMVGERSPIQCKRKPDDEAGMAMALHRLTIRGIR